MTDSFSPTMTAAVTMGHGGPEMIEVRSDWPMPAPEPGEVLVRVTAAALNNTDIWARQGSYGSPGDPDAVTGWKGVPLSFPLIQGIDIAGVVGAVGAGVSEDWLGKRVIIDPTMKYNGEFPVDIIGSEGDGGFAQFHVCPERQLRDVTNSPLSDAQLSCLPTAYGTAIGMINRAGCAPGHRVLVTGSSGGVGMAAIQLLLHLGCEVVAHTSESKKDLVQAQGVDAITVRGTEDLENLRGINIVVDVVGGDEFGALIDTLVDGGTLVTAGAIAGPVVPFDIRRLYLNQRRLIGSTMHTPADFVQLAEIADDGGINPLVAQTFPLTEIAAAQEKFLAKDFIGKLVVLP